MSIFYVTDGLKFWQIPEVFIKGTNIKYLRVPDQVLDQVKEDEEAKKTKHEGRSGFSKRNDKQNFKPQGGSGRGGRGGSARGGNSGRVRLKA